LELYPKTLGPEELVTYQTSSGTLFSRHSEVLPVYEKVIIFTNQFYLTN